MSNGKSNSRNKKDIVLNQVKAALDKYVQIHPGAKTDSYRQNSVSIRIRVIDPTFKNLDKIQRHEKVWTFLEQLPDDVINDITMLVLLAPGEESKSFSNLEFEDPVPSEL